MAADVSRVKSEIDFQRLYALFAAYEADLPSELRHGIVPEIADLRAAYARQNAAFLALVGEESAGCVAVMRLDAERAVLLRLFVRPEHRGLGAARALVIAAIDFAQSQGYRRLVLDTNKKRLTAAYALYRSLGFQECSPFAIVTYEDPTFMELQLPRILADDRI